jgi:hypothetical protein
VHTDDKKMVSQQTLLQSLYACADRHVHTQLHAHGAARRLITPDMELRKAIRWLCDPAEESSVAEEAGRPRNGSVGLVLRRF